jgi:hypothetical protein
MSLVIAAVTPCGTPLNESVGALLASLAQNPEATTSVEASFEPPFEPSPAITERELGFAASAHADAAPEALLSVNTMAGEAPPTGQGGAFKVRLFDSAVKPPP